MYVSIVKAQSSLAVGSFIFLFFYFYFIFNFIWSDYFALKKKNEKKKTKKTPKKQNKQLCVRCHRLGSVNFGRWFIHIFAFLFLFLLFIYLSSIMFFFNKNNKKV
jgi:Na+/melibiose symporter-like transporter